jgi:hypothetical protein
MVWGKLHGLNVNLEDWIPCEKANLQSDIPLSNISQTYRQSIVKILSHLVHGFENAASAWEEKKDEEGKLR